MDFMTLFTIVANICSVVGAISAGLALQQLLTQKKEKKRLQHIVTVVLKCTEDNREIFPLRVRRKDITRAELQGILGTIKMRDVNSRYFLGYLNTKECRLTIETLQGSNNKQEHLVIPCTAKEIDQFDPSELVSGN